MTWCHICHCRCTNCSASWNYEQHKHSLKTHSDTLGFFKTFSAKNNINIKWNWCGMNLQLIWTKKRLVYTFIYVTFKVRYTTAHSHTALYFNKKSIKAEQCEHCDMWIKQIHQNRNGTGRMKTVLLCKNSRSFDLILSYENTYESHSL